MSNVMKAVQISDFGGQNVLALNTVDIPTPKVDEVLIKVRAASVNPVDWKIREGYLQPLLNHSLPLTLGWDVAGEVVATGNNVTSLAIGDAVYSRPEIANNGSYAEYIAVSADEVAIKPASLSWQEAAGVPLAALTAWQALNEYVQLKQGERVLIHGGSGAVGQFAIQLAKLRGATVYTTTSSRNTELVLGLGADHVIDYREKDFSTLEDLDVVFDTIGGETQDNSFKTLKKGGRLVSIAKTPEEDKAAAFGVNASFCFVLPNRAQLEKLAVLADAGQLTVTIDSEFALNQVADAHARSETGRAQGKIIINVSA
ncbi:NADP-dependent oxidoreductase [Enterovibrio norvegicus]|uniref:NADPH:quinone reductase n=1 Tax=Enterovibrio norvegicus DSM 15893 TaxID=1121869 RepID=A0A1I5M690_9GAMM|nr:NADP-dependent oxidoreductase [Enterovibrio norvegicus]SFP05045.1 NADPH:quinone reductase [Enterovibrio norvegicus DSM 15893]